MLLLDELTKTSNNLCFKLELLSDSCWSEVLISHLHTFNQFKKKKKKESELNTNWKLPSFIFGLNPFKNMDSWGKTTKEIFLVAKIKKKRCMDTTTPVQFHIFQAILEQRVGSPALIVGRTQFSISRYIQGRRVPCLFQGVHFPVPIYWIALNYHLICSIVPGRHLFPLSPCWCFYFLFFFSFSPCSLTNTEDCVSISHLPTVPASSLIIRALSQSMAATLTGTEMEMNEVLFSPSWNTREWHRA